MNLDLGTGIHFNLVQTQPQAKDMFAEISVDPLVVITKTNITVELGQQREQPFAVCVDKRLPCDEHVALHQFTFVQVQVEILAETRLAVVKDLDERVEVGTLAGIGKPLESGIAGLVTVCTGNDFMGFQDSLCLVLGDAGLVLLGRREEPAVMLQTDYTGLGVFPHVVQCGQLAVPWVKIVDIDSLVGFVHDEFFSD